MFLSIFSFLLFSQAYADCKSILAPEDQNSTLFKMLSNEEIMNRLVPNGDPYWETVAESVAKLPQNAQQDFHWHDDARDIILSMRSDDQGRVEIFIHQIKISGAKFGQTSKGLSMQFGRFIVAISEGFLTRSSSGITTHEVNLIAKTVVNKDLLKNLQALGFRKSAFNQFFSTWGYRTSLPVIVIGFASRFLAPQLASFVPYELYIGFGLSALGYRANNSSLTLKLIRH